MSLPRAPRVALITALGTLALAACGNVESVSVDAAPEADAADMPDAPPAPDATVDAGFDAGPTPLHCKQIHDLDPRFPSGKYTIDPDGFASGAPFEVYCDMDTDGGGWTVVFFPSNLNYKGEAMPYTSSTPTLLQLSTFALVAYRHQNQTAYANYARFALPQAWKAASPFNQDGQDVALEVSVNGGPAKQGTLRFGKFNFSQQCADDWTPAAAPFGRLCILGAGTVPFFSGFTDPDRNADYCSDSTQAYSTVVCAADLRFSIAVR